MGPVLLSAVLATGAPVRLRNPPPPGRRRARRADQLLVLLRLGAAWTHSVPSAGHRALAGHAEYVDRLFADGSLVIAGPLLNDSGMVALEAVRGAVLVLRVETPEEARRLAEEDPAVRAGLLEVVEVRRWGIGLSGRE